MYSESGQKIVLGNLNEPNDFEGAIFDFSYGNFFPTKVQKSDKQNNPLLLNPEEKWEKSQEEWQIFSYSTRTFYSEKLIMFNKN